MLTFDDFIFDDFTVDPNSGELFRQGERVALQEKPFQLLVALLERAGEVVPRDVLIAHLWPDVHVDFDGNLNAAARKLRDALGDSAGAPRWIETVPRRGYRFIGTLGRPTAKPSNEPPGEPSNEPPGEPSNEPPGEPSNEPPSEPRPTADTPPKAGRFPVWTTAAVALMVLLTVVVLASRRSPAPKPERVTLVVLPFENLSGDPGQDFIGDGMTEELITALGRIDPERLGVLARVTSMTYKGTTHDAGQIGRQLGVDYLLEGSFRGDAEHARITAQLIVVEDQTHLWAETYDAELDALLDVQARIAHRIADSLTLQLLDGPRAATRIPEAYDHYLRGRYQWSRFEAEGYRLAIAELKRALELDPHYALALAALADAYNLYAFVAPEGPKEWLEHARQTAERALALAPDLAEAHNSLGFAILYGEYDAHAADQHFHRALELDPGQAMAYHWRAGALAALGRHDQAITAARHALELDPLSLSVRSDLGWYYLFADRWQEAAEECRATLERSPGYGWALACLVEAELRQGNEAEALRHLVDRLRQKGEPLPDLEGMEAGQALEAIHRRSLENELAKSPDQANPFYRAVLHTRLGQLDPALAALEAAHIHHDPWLVFLWQDPRLDPLHPHPGFTELAKRLDIEVGSP